MRRLLILASLIVTIATATYAQEPMPMPTGTVAQTGPDSSMGGGLVVNVVASDGSLLPGVTVTVTSASGIFLTSVTGADGRARFPLVPLGRVKVASLYAGVYGAT